MFSEPELKTEPAFGFRSVFVTIEVSDVEATPFNPAAVALLNDIIGRMCLIRSEGATVPLVALRNKMRYLL